MSGGGKIGQGTQPQFSQKRPQMAPGAPPMQGSQWGAPSGNGSFGNGPAPAFGAGGPPQMDDQQMLWPGGSQGFYAKQRGGPAFGAGGPPQMDDQQMLWPGGSQGFYAKQRGGPAFGAGGLLGGATQQPAQFGSDGMQLPGTGFSGQGMTPYMPGVQPSPAGQQLPNQSGLLNSLGSLNSPRQAGQQQWTPKRIAARNAASFAGRMQRSGRPLIVNGRLVKGQ